MKIMTAQEALDISNPAADELERKEIEAAKPLAEELLKAIMAEVERESQRGQTVASIYRDYDTNNRRAFQMVKETMRDLGYRAYLDFLPGSIGQDGERGIPAQDTLYVTWSNPQQVTRAMAQAKSTKEPGYFKRLLKALLHG